MSHYGSLERSFRLNKGKSIPQHLERYQLNMKKLLMTLSTVLASTSAFADLSLTIKTADGLNLKATGVYLTTSEKLGCQRLSMADGKLEMLPKAQDKNIQIQKLNNTNVLTVDGTLKDRCESELNGFSFKVIHPSISETSARISVIESPENQANKVQKVIYKKYESPFSGTFYGLSEEESRVLVGPNGEANIEISLEQ